jgi:hypothetical protein
MRAKQFSPQEAVTRTPDEATGASVSQSAPTSTPENESPPKTLPAVPKKRFSALGPLHHPGIYIWYVVFATLDITLTWMILHLGGAELNAFADWIITRYDIIGTVIYKYALVVLVITICEIVTAAKPRVGRRLAEWSVAITVVPVVVALAQIWFEVFIKHSEWRWALDQ